MVQKYQVPTHFAFWFCVICHKMHLAIRHSFFNKVVFIYFSEKRFMLQLGPGPVSLTYLLFCSNCIWFFLKIIFLYLFHFLALIFTFYIREFSIKQKQKKEKGSLPHFIVRLIVQFMLTFADDVVFRIR